MMAYIKTKRNYRTYEPIVVDHSRIEIIKEIVSKYKGNTGKFCSEMQSELVSCRDCRLYNITRYDNNCYIRAFSDGDECASHHVTMHICNSINVKVLL